MEIWKQLSPASIRLDIPARDKAEILATLIQGLVEWLEPRAAETADPEPLSAALERVRHAVRPGSLVIVVSDFFTLDEDCNRHLSRLRQHNDVIGCQVVDAAEYQLPPGRYPITDGEQSAILDTGGRDYRWYSQSVSV